MIKLLVSRNPLRNSNEHSPLEGLLQQEFYKKKEIKIFVTRTNIKNSEN